MDRFGFVETAKAEELAKDLGAAAIAVKLDVRDKAQIDAAVAKAVHQLSPGPGGAVTIPSPFFGWAGLPTYRPAAAGAA